MDFTGIYKILLQEAIDQNKIINAINQKRILTIYYKADREENEIEGWRRIEPFCAGINKFGNPVVRAWQETGVSNSYPPGKAHDPLTGVPGWRMFRMDKIVSLVTEPKHFYEPKPKYNPKDKDMVTIFAAANFGTGQTGTQEPIKPEPTKPIQTAPKVAPAKPVPTAPIAPVQPKQQPVAPPKPQVVEPVKPKAPPIPVGTKPALPQIKKHTQADKQKSYFDKLTDKFKHLINYRPKR